ncbi:unnamed protein product [Ambrosiozyma monospora]|uniref:Unnamed protein product n=1 Tax=Ambrosiozyma monospora TaxID=43982 RepID=A0ACB5TCX3_AMBMO|nr:unnamed protein product [Ambrosiozyma monospora]
MCSAAPSTKLQSKRRIVPTESRKRALFSCDRCKLRKTKCKRIQNNDLKYDNITPCVQCTKAGVACTTSIPRKKRFYGPIENISLHYKCLLALATGLFPDKDIYNIEELIELGRSFKFEMPSIDSNEEIQGLKHPDDVPAKSGAKRPKKEELSSTGAKDEHQDKKIKLEDEGNILKKEKEEAKSKKTVPSASKSASAAPKPVEEMEVSKSSEASNVEDDGDESSEPLTMVVKTPVVSKSKPTVQEHVVRISKSEVHISEPPKLPPNIKIRNNNKAKERLIMDRFGHTHFIGNFEIVQYRQ